MHDASLPPVAQIRALLTASGIAEVDESRFELIAKGASGRCIMRAYGVIGIVWTHARADNSSFLDAARGLASYGMAVPAIIDSWQDAEGNGACLVRDLGRRDLLSYRQEGEQDWATLRTLYRCSFEAVLPLYALRPDWELQAPFDKALYRWEQEYFSDHFIALHARVADGAREELMQQGLWMELAEDLASLPRMPVHRDLQSQNIMIHEDRAWLIDFQGMRMGRYEYDLGSLIFDPYMDFSLEQRLELLALWEEVSGVAVDRSIFCACTLQRLMQALGAFANLGYRQEKDWYRGMIDPAIRGIHQLATLMPEGAAARRLYTMLLSEGCL